jgi:DNA-binding transcriptional LysR family regulator
VAVRFHERGKATRGSPAQARGEGLRAIALDDPRIRWNLSAAVNADRRLTAATRTLLDALIQASRGG